METLNFSQVCLIYGGHFGGRHFENLSSKAFDLPFRFHSAIEIKVSKGDNGTVNFSGSLLKFCSILWEKFRPKFPKFVECLKHVVLFCCWNKMYSVTSLEHFVNSMEFCLEVRVNSILLSAAFRVHGLSLSILIYFASFAFIDITAVFV